MKRLSAEQLHDAISQATQVFGNYRRRDLLYETPLPPVRFWTELATPEELGDREAKTFLQAFELAGAHGATSRAKVCAVRMPKMG